MNDRRALVVLALLHLAIVAVVQPRGDFPLNDDWAYAHSAQWLLEEHRIRLSQWIAMNLVPQTILGAGVTAAFGFSFETLRHLTQVVAVAAMGLTYAWFRAAKLAPTAALVATCAIVAFPPWAQLANTYMTDLYGLSLGMAAAICFVRALESPGARWVVAGTAIAIIGVLQRQVVLVIPFAFMAALLWTRRPRTLGVVAMAVLPFAACMLAEALYHAYLVTGPGHSRGAARGARAPRAFRPQGADERGRRTRVAALEPRQHRRAPRPALFRLVPVVGHGQRVAHRALAGARGRSSRSPRRASRWRGIRLTVSCRCSIARGSGPFVLYDSLRHLAPIDRSPGLFWALLGVVASCGLAALVALAARASAKALANHADPILVFSLVAIVAYLGPFIVTDYIDRYLLFVLPFIFVAWARAWPAPSLAWSRSLGLAWIAAAIGLGAVATRDYFSWNRARWDAIRLAEKLGGTPETIDGGFEYNGYRRFERSGGGAPAGKSWWWVKDDVFVVAFSPVRGYDVVERWPVRTVLPRTPREIVLLKRRP
jgi:hypothetical protein